MSSPRGAVSTTVRRGLLASMLTRVLRHPLVMSVKRPIRDLQWTIRAAGLENADVPEHVRSVLFVCLGNICRSPFAALQAGRRFAEAEWPEVVCASAGLWPTQAARPPREACEVAATYRLSLECHEPQPLTPELMQASDMIVVMEAAQLRELRGRYPEHGPRLFLLSMFDPHPAGAFERYNIADPFGHPLWAYERCYRRIADAVDALVATAATRRRVAPPGPLHPTGIPK